MSHFQEIRSFTFGHWPAVIKKQNEVDSTLIVTQGMFVQSGSELFSTPFLYRLDVKRCKPPRWITFHINLCQTGVTNRGPATVFHDFFSFPLRQIISLFCVVAKAWLSLPVSLPLSMSLFSFLYSISLQCLQAPEPNSTLTRSHSIHYV